MARRKAEMRPSSPRSSRISSTVARYSRSSDAKLAAGTRLGCADQGAVLARDGDRPAAAGQADLL
jgi:hypothetical protein